MKEIGVRAVVKNVNGFLSDIKRMTKSAEGMADGLLDFGSMLSGMGVENFSDDILNMAGAFASAGPEAMIIGALIQKIGQNVKETKEKVKNFVEQGLKFLITTLKTLKDITIKVINFALTPFKKAWDAITGVIKRVSEIATGILIANTIRKLGQMIADAGASALEAAINFQTLEVRLKGLAARQFLNTGEVETFSEALDMAGIKSKELLDWVVDLSLKAPISTDAIANTLTLATSYGLGEKAAKDMTKAVLTFASGMGLTDVAQRRIIENFGQMIQQGKITSMELRDMGRGAFVPVGDLLKRTAELLGMTADEFDGTAGSVNEFAGKNGLDAVQASIQAFIDLTDEEFSGSIERMGNTIQGLQQRFKNLVASVVGLNILKTPLDLIGQSIGKVFVKLAESELLQTVSKEIGDTLALIVGDILGEMPSVETIVTNIENAMVKISEALKLFREGDTMGGLAMLGVPQSLLDFIDKVKTFTNEGAFATFLENVTGGFKNIKDFWSENKETIKEALLVALGQITDALGIEMPTDPGESFFKWTEDLDVETVVGGIQSVTTAIVDFIDMANTLPAKIEEWLPYIKLIGTTFLLIKHPILGLGLVMIQAFNGIKTWWETTVVPWLTEQASLIQSAFSGLGGVGSMSGAPVPGGGVSSNITSVAPTSQNITTNNISVNASYTKPQSPAKVRDDVHVMLMGVRH